MPLEESREAAKLVVETSGIFSSFWHWVIAAIGTMLSGIGVALVALWGHLTGRIAALEKSHVTDLRLKEHIVDENARFDVLFDKHDRMMLKYDHLMDELSRVAQAVARIEGKLDK